MSAAFPDRLFSPRDADLDRNESLGRDRDGIRELCGSRGRGHIAIE